MPAKALNDREIRAAKTPPGRRQLDLRDDDPRGLILRVYDSGTKVWGILYRRREDNRRRWYKLGEYPGVSLATARDLAKVELGRIAKGEDPQAHKEALRRRGKTETVADLATLYLEKYAKPTKKPRGYEFDRWQLETYVLPEWKGHAVDEIGRGDVRHLLEDLASGAIAANGKPTTTAPRNLRALLTKMFEFAVEREILSANPARGVKLPPGASKSTDGRERVLSDSEIKALWGQIERLEQDAATKEQAPVTATAFRLMLLTAQRPGEVLRMRWQDIEGEWWTVPAAHTKNGLDNRVFLVPEARATLDSLRKETGRSPWVLQSPYPPRSGKSRTRGRLTTVKTANRTMRKKMGGARWTPHDLRRTAATGMRRLGVDRLVVKAILNHRDRSTTAIYDRYGMDPEKKAALERWAKKVSAIVSGETVQVLPFRQEA